MWPIIYLERLYNTLCLERHYNTLLTEEALKYFIAWRGIKYLSLERLYNTLNAWSLLRWQSYFKLRMSIVYVNPKKSIFNATDLVIVGKKKAVGGRTALDDGTKTRIRNLKHPMIMGDLLSTVGSWTRPFCTCFISSHS